MKIRVRNPSHLYLCHPQLLPSPHVMTPWTQLYESYNDCAYITTMGFDVTTFHQLLDSGYADKWNSTPIPRADVSGQGEPCIGACSLDAAGALGLTLHFLSSAMHEILLQQIFTLIPTTVNRYLDFALDILLHTLRDIPEGAIHFPDHNEIIEDNLLIFACHSKLMGGFGSIDGLSLPCQEADDPEVENATYNGWKSVIISAVLNAPGSWHDLHTSCPIYNQLRWKTPDGYYLIADSAFPHGMAAVSGKIQAPLKSGAVLPGNAHKQAELLMFNQQLLSYCQTTEWGMQMMQGLFLEVCVRLSNIRAICVGINQICSVYMPIWKALEDEQLWLDVGNVLFGDIHHCDYVACYHLVVQTP
ncbi:hypothetical protein BDR05DRAFT_978730 [Suillus weaverae]|nr:hypothetical protein BDR05DRAFT_978730 [Suillus weaverae]